MRTWMGKEENDGGGCANVKAEDCCGAAGGIARIRVYMRRLDKNEARRWGVCLCVGTEIFHTQR